MDKRDFLFKFLPKGVRNKLKLDEEALFSVTDQLTADKITNELLKFISCEATITDGTACIGGNTFSLSRIFQHVNAVELDKTRYEYLMHNLDALGVDNVSCYFGDIMDWLPNLDHTLLFLDPPWGGPEYKTQDLVDLYLSSIPLANVCERCCSTTKYIALKTPTNFNIDKFLEDTKSYMTLIHKNTKLRKLNLYLFETFSS
jgi:16S rRNA G966 N2-methylase RsmD